MDHGEMDGVSARAPRRDRRCAATGPVLSAYRWAQSWVLISVLAHRAGRGVPRAWPHTHTTSWLDGRYVCAPRARRERKPSRLGRCVVVPGDRGRGPACVGWGARARVQLYRTR